MKSGNSKPVKKIPKEVFDASMPNGGSSHIDTRSKISRDQKRRGWNSNWLMF
tara:strand:+ start:3378 stop:3533 length:156 start_codon:yes stop_codon:yes gene_type:complete